MVRLIHAARRHAAAGHCGCFSLFGLLGDHHICDQHETRDGCSILSSQPRYLSRIDYAAFHKVFILFALGIEADVYQEKQQLIAEAIKTEGIAEAKGIQEMNNALAGSGGEAIVKLRITEAIQGKRIMLLPVSEGGMNLKTTDINRLIETLGVKALSDKHGQQ